MVKIAITTILFIPWLRGLEVKENNNKNVRIKNFSCFWKNFPPHCIFLLTQFSWKKRKKGKKKRRRKDKEEGNKGNLWLCYFSSFLSLFFQSSIEGTTIDSESQFGQRNRRNFLLSIPCPWIQQQFSSLPLSNFNP